MKRLICKFKKSILFSIFLLSFSALPLFAQSNNSLERKKVRVGYFLGEGFQEISPIDGHRSGYCYEYLQTLSYYTGWEYEYVDCSWAGALEMIAKGEIDILAEVSKTPEREKFMLYADHPMGAEDYYFYVLPDNPKKIRSEDLSTVNGVRVGGNEGSYQVITFREWCAENGVQCEIIESEDEEERAEIFHRGELDAIVDNDFYLNQGWVPLFKTGKSDYYICVTPYRHDILDELNEAQEKLFEDSPLYIEKLQGIYFPKDVIVKDLNNRELEWLERHRKTHGKIKLGYTDDYLPYCTKNAETGEMEGAITVFIDNLKDTFGIEIESVAFDDREKLYEAVRNDEVDACFPFYNMLWQSEELGIMQTDALVDFPVAYIFRKNEYDESKSQKTFAVSRTSQMHIAYIHDRHPGTSIVFYDDYTNCMDAVVKGEVDGMYINSFILSRFYEAYQSHKGLDIIYMPNDTTLSIGVSYYNPELLTIFNKSIALLDDSVKTSYLVHNSQTEQEYSFKRFFREHYATIILFIVVLSVLIVAFFWDQLARVRTAQKQAEVEKQKAEDVNSKLVAAIKREKESQTVVHEAFDAANRANNAKTEFLASMSHDIRTPMNAIVGMTAIAAANIDDKEKIQHCLSEITISSKHLLGLINEVLDMNKIESGKLSLSETEFNLANLVDDFISLSKPLVKEKDHVLVVNIHDVKHENVIGDSDRIQQSLMNFMSNAVKYTPNGGTIKISITEKQTNRPKIGCYEFVIEDNGIGMSEDFVKVMFEPFTRADDERAIKQQGTGLGMSITRNIIQMMNGNIKVESELNKGTKVTATIFLELQESDEKIDYASLINLPVLVADDDKTSCESTCFILNDLGMRSEWVLSGREAVERVSYRHEKQDDFFAVIVDWKMPEMDGVATTRAIREKVGDEVPIIIISAYDWSDIEADALAAGANGFITKPIFKSKVAQTFLKFTDKTKVVEDSEKQSTLDKYRDGKFEDTNILLVEDNEINAEIAVEILKMTGLNVEHVWNGQEAIDKLNATEDDYYKLIFMDIQMPILNGFEATQLIRSSDREYLKNIPIVAMSANAFAEDVQKSLSSGMNEHISKPLDFDRLYNILNKWVNKK